MRGKCFERRPDAVHHFGLQEMLQRGEAMRGRHVIGAVPSSIEVGTKAAQPVDGYADHDPAEPGAKSLGIDQQVQVAKRADERLLGEILRLGGIVHCGSGQHGRLPVVATDQLVAGFRRSLSGFGYQRSDAFRLHVHHCRVLRANRCTRPCREG